MHWSYCSLALSHRCGLSRQVVYVFMCIHFQVSILVSDEYSSHQCLHPLHGVFQAPHPCEIKDDSSSIPVRTLWSADRRLFIPSASRQKKGCTNHPTRKHSCPWPYLYWWEEEGVRQLLPVKETHTIWPWYWNTLSVPYLFCTSVPCWMPGGVPHQTPGSSWCRGVNRVSNCYPSNRTQCWSLHVLTHWPLRCGNNFTSVFSTHVFHELLSIISCEIGPRWVP